MAYPAHVLGYCSPILILECVRRYGCFRGGFLPSLLRRGGGPWASQRLVDVAEAGTVVAPRRRRWEWRLLLVVVGNSELSGGVAQRQRP